MSSMKERASWETTRADRRRWRERPAVMRPSPARVRARRSKAGRPGRVPTTRPVRRAIPRVNASTAPSMRTSPARGVKRAAKPTRASRVRAATRRPRAPPASASRVLSVRRCRRRRWRPAPRAARTASSRPRSLRRARLRFATFAQAIRRTRATVAVRRSRIGRMAPNPSTSSRSGSMSTAVHPSFSLGYAAASRAEIPASAVRAWSGVASCLRRARTRLSACRPRCASPLSCAAMAASGA